MPTRILENEITDDPLGRGYAGMNDADLLISLNTVNRNRNRAEVTVREVKAAINVAEYNTRTDAQKQQMIELLKRDDLDLFGLDRDILIDIFGGGSTTVSNLLTARVESISRGVEITWGVVTEKDLRVYTISRALPS